VTDWIEHNGGPQPVADDVWVCLDGDPIGDGWTCAWLATQLRWLEIDRYRILNQHLIDAARLEGIRLGLEAAEKIVWKDSRWMGFDGPSIGDRLCRTLRALKPDTIAREAVLDQLTSEAQADNMGYDNEPR